MNFKRFYDYDVYEDGRIFSHLSNRFLNIKPNRFGYITTVLYVNSKQLRVRVHRLVAELFLGPAPENKPIINHIDGNKQNNHFTNLEWCDYDTNNRHARETGLNNVSEANRKRYSDPEFRRRQGEQISRKLRESGATRGEKNGRFRYRIYDSCNNVLTRSQLAELFGRSQANTDKLICEYTKGIINPLFVKYSIRVEDIKAKSQSTIENS